MIHLESGQDRCLSIKNKILRVLMVASWMYYPIPVSGVKVDRFSAILGGIEPVRSCEVET
jgi:hypothetical protein